MQANGRGSGPCGGRFHQPLASGLCELLISDTPRIAGYRQIADQVF